MPKNNLQIYYITCCKSEHCGQPSYSQP